MASRLVDALRGRWASRVDRDEASVEGGCNPPIVEQALGAGNGSSTTTRGIGSSVVRRCIGGFQPGLDLDRLPDGCQIAQFTVLDVDLGARALLAERQHGAAPAGQGHQAGEAAAERAALVVAVGGERRLQTQASGGCGQDAKFHRPSQGNVGEQVVLQLLGRHRSASGQVPGRASVRADGRAVKCAALSGRCTGDPWARDNGGMNQGSKPSRSLPLQGRRVFVARPAGEARGLLHSLRAAGATALNLPVLRLQGEPAGNFTATAVEFAAADRWLFSSPASVRHAARLDRECNAGLFGQQGRLARSAQAGQVFAPGPGTAQALARAGVADVRTPSLRFDSEGLLALPELTHPLSGRLYLVGAPGGRGVLAPALTARGLQVIPIHVYRRVAMRLPASRIAALITAEKPVLLLSSQAALQSLVAAIPEARLPALAAQAGLVVASDRLAEHARAQGFHHVHVAGSARPQDLLAATIELINGGFG